MYLAMVVVSELLLWLTIHRASRTKEYLSAYAINVQHHEAWVERVERRETYTDSQGNTRTRTVVEFHRHPDIWLLECNCGFPTNITRDVYNSCRLQWGTPEQWINPPHINCVSGGGGQLYQWNGVYEDAVTRTFKGLYINYVANSNSIFHRGNVSKSEAEKLGLVDYPSFKMRYLETDVILCSPKLEDRMQVAPNSQRAFQLINAFEGETRQIHVFILMFDAAQQGVATALKQQAYWNGGNKNEFVVCIGVEPRQSASEGTVENTPATVKWCKAFSWCDLPNLESATESWFIANPGLDFQAYAQWLRSNVGLWKRKEFSDFKYLGVTLSPKREALVAIVSLILCAVMTCIAFSVAIDERRNSFDASQRFDTYGYQLIDRYILNN